MNRARALLITLTVAALAAVVPAASADPGSGPPTITINNPQDGSVLYVDGHGPLDFSCAPGAAPIASCSADHEEIDYSEGEHAITVTAEDTAGVVATKTVHYRVAKHPQTVAFTTDPPEGATWGRFPYFAEATASSGLKATISVDPASTGCAGEAAEADPFVAISFPHPGTCIIHADQAGTDTVAPAPRVTQTFEVGKLKSYVSTTKASKGLLGLTPTTFRAEVDADTFFGPGQVVSGYPGATVTFSVGGKKMCSAKSVVVGTDGPFTVTAVATCKATIGLGHALRNSYVASFAGDDLYLPSSATGKLQ
ncbi:hypothetical protein ABIE44_000690 [Marmoricola sp. OAE513]|uniref:hypothetical protein n=1 Tax=Marmoricola sp. OAE513 TaxID=2817894 RepID=UPI001AEB58D2